MASTPRRISSKRGRNIGKGALAGLVGGLAATWAMSHAQAWWSQQLAGGEPQSAAGRHDARDWQERTEGQNANELVAQAVAERTIDRPLHQNELGVAAAGVHYAFGASMGALYGALTEVAPGVTAGTGLGYGAFVWGSADEIALPLVGLSRPTTERPLDAHAQSLAAHVVYGVTLEVVRRGVRKLL